MSENKNGSKTAVQATLRHQKNPKQPLLECEQCYYQHENRHPCLFCSKCLKSISEGPTNSGPNKNADFSTSTDAAYGNSRQQDDGTKANVRNTSANNEFWETFMQLKESKQSVIPTSGEKVTEKRINIMNQKGKKWEKRATRCGFCPPEAKRSPLISFCVHCRKHLCGACSSIHETDALCKHHGTIDLSKNKNAALL